MRCPCVNCICVPVCRHKRYSILIRCDLIQEYMAWMLVKHVDHNIHGAMHRKIIYRVLKPTAWIIDNDGFVDNIETPGLYLYT